jgi:hypothetical protein
LTSGDEGEILRSELIADEPNVAERIAAGNRTSLSGRSPWQCKRDGETGKSQQVHGALLVHSDCRA